MYIVVKHRNKRWLLYKIFYTIATRSPVIYRFNQSKNMSAHLQAFQIDPDFNTLKIFTLALISKIMKVFTTTTTTTSLYDIPLFYY